MKKLKAIKINVATQTVEEIEVEHSLKGYYVALQCQYIEVGARLPGHVVFVDEEGLLYNNPWADGFFAISHNSLNRPITLRGHGLILGVNPKDQSKESDIRMNELEGLGIFFL